MEKCGPRLRCEREQPILKPELPKDHGRLKDFEAALGDPICLKLRMMDRETVLDLWRWPMYL
jgi:hypothetical protein